MTVCFNTAFNTSPDNFWSWMLNIFSFHAFGKSDGQVSMDYSKKFSIEPNNLTRNDCVELVERIYGDFISSNFQNQSGGTLIGYSPQEDSAVCLTDLFLYLNAWLLVIFLVTCYVFRRERGKHVPAAALVTKSESAQTTPELSTVVLSPMIIDEEEPEEFLLTAGQSMLDATLPNYEEIVVENGVDFTISTRIFTDNLSQKDLSDFDSLGETIQEEDAFELHGTCEDSGSEEDEAADQEGDAEIVESWTSDLFDRLKHLEKIEKVPSSPISPTSSPSKTPSKRSSKNFLEINIEKVKQLTPRKKAHRLCKSSDSDTKLETRKSGIPVRKSSYQKLPFSP